MTGRIVASRELPDLPDLWAPVGTAELPDGVAAAFEARDWTTLRRQLSTVMDGAITDGPYGRELLQLVMSLPGGFDTVFDRYRVAAMLDHGDWDGVRSALPGQLIEVHEINGKRDIFTASIDRSHIPEGETLNQAFVFELWEFLCRNDVGRTRHWVQRQFGHYPCPLWEREDVPLGRHLRYRPLLDNGLLAFLNLSPGACQWHTR